jgi:hypothetical protein
MRLKIREALLDDLRALAHLDGVVTADEHAILAEVERQLHGFEQLLVEVERDQVVDWSEFLALRRARKQIFEHAIHRAFEDGEVTDDERRLLVRIAEHLPDVR